MSVIQNNIFYLEKFSFFKPNIKSPHANKQLNCNGRACAECGHCRDWYWCPDGDGKEYTKRDDATCTSDGYDRGFRLPFRDGYFDFAANDNEHNGDHHYLYHHFIYSISYFDGIDVIDNRLCQCDDNRS